MKKSPPRHSEQTAFEVVDNCLQVGGMPLTRLARRVGATPFYAYDRSVLTRRVGELRAILPDEVRLHYAIKANPMPALVQHMAGLVDGFDLASGHEMQVALDTPMPAANISIAGPGKSEQELSSAIAAGITINVESETELQRIIALAKQAPERPRVAIRVNPDFELKASGMKMSGGPKPFGIDAERVPAVLTRLGQLDLEFIGLHIFSGSQNLRADALIEAQNNTIDLAIRLAADAPGPLRKLNIGGGFGIPYFPGETPLDVQPVADNLQSRLADVKQALGDPEIIIELGRYLVGPAGVYVCKVRDRKLSREQVYLVTDGGLHHHLAASGNFGQVIRKNYPVLIGNRVASEHTETSSIVGPLCTPLDLLADRMELPVADIDDLVVILQSGAYGLTASPTDFLSHPHPREVLV